ncbi:MAG: glutaredoxin family protein [Gammaproteobacteria bacterium]|nr:glutaredoxin family protein [Gammaproteobacteria bacterium]
MIIRHFICLLVFCSNPAYAEIYKWIDHTGRIHFGDAPGQSQQAQRVAVEINTYQSDINSDSSSELNQSSVVMYATSWCGYCRKARKYFKANDIAYTEYDIEKDMSAKRRYDAFGGRGVPVIFAGNRRMNGFSETGFKRLYDSVVN